MTATSDDGGPDDLVYEEYDLADARVVMIADPANHNAWLQSDVVTEVVP